MAIVQMTPLSLTSMEYPPLNLTSQKKNANSESLITGVLLHIKITQNLTFFNTGRLSVFRDLRTTNSAMISLIHRSEPGVHKKWQGLILGKEKVEFVNSVSSWVHELLAS